MQPLSKRTRHIYLLSLVSLFILFLPLVILYATGYRFKSGFGLVETGGIFLSVPRSGATISLNGEEAGRSGVLTRSLYVDNLSANSYAVHVALPGYYPWYRTLVVEPRIVTDAYAFLVPQEFEVVKLTRVASTSPLNTLASTTRSVVRETYDRYVYAFVPATSTPILPIRAIVNMGTTSTSTVVVPADTAGENHLIVQAGNLVVSWVGATSTIPSNYCVKPSSCTRTIVIDHGKSSVVSAHFYAGGIVYSTKEGGIFLTEADVRPTPLTVPLYPTRGADFRIIDGSLIVKDGKILYEITGL